MKKSRLPLLSAAMLTLVLCLAAAPAQADTLYFTVDRNDVFSIDTASPGSAPTVVVTGLGLAEFQNLAGSCQGSLFALGNTTIMRIDTATGSVTDIATNLGAVGAGNAVGLVASADGTRLWWGRTDGKVYTRLVSDPVSAAPTLVASGGSLALLARVGDKLVLRDTSGARTLDAAAGPAAPVPVSGVVASGQIYIGSDTTHAYYERDLLPPTTTADYMIGSIDPATGVVKDDVAEVGTQPGVLTAKDGTLWLFDASADDLYKIDLATGTGGTTVINGAVGGLVGGAAFTGCTKPVVPPAAPAATPTAAPVAAASPTAKPKPLKIFPVTGTAANPTVHVRVPGAGVLTLSGTMTSSDPMAAFTGRATVPACTRVTKRVATAGVVRLTCRVTADAQAARRFGPVTVRLTTAYKPGTGKAQTTTRVMVLRALGTSESVTG
jgi:hypothetical protein